MVWFFLVSTTLLSGVSVNSDTSVCSGVSKINILCGWCHGSLQAQTAVDYMVSVSTLSSKTDCLSVNDHTNPTPTHTHARKSQHKLEM